MGLTSWLGDLAGMIYPNVCEVCANTLVHGEHTLCLHCLHDMPRTRLHTQSFNEIHKRLAGHTPISKAAAYFYYYRENPYAELIHRAKYNNRPALAKTLARMFAEEIMPSGFFDGIDLILPVPLHYLKELKRGYNQSHEIAKGLREATGIEIADNLIAKKAHSTQTRRSAFERWLNTGNIYTVAEPHELADKHILIVDDVITTGATVLHCADAVHINEPSAKISVAALGFTHGI